MKSRLLFAPGLIACTLLMLCTSAWATKPKPTPASPPDTAVITDLNAVATSGSKSVSASGSKSNATSNSTSGAKSGSVSEAASSSDNAVQFHSDDDTFIPRQVPPTLLPMLLVSECGAGASAGGGGTGGTGAISAVFTSKRCYALRSAVQFFAIGEYETGCELLIYANREAFGKVKKPDCAKVAARLDAEARSVVTHSTGCPDCASKEELKRAFERSVGK